MMVPDRPVSYVSLFPALTWWPRRPDWEADRQSSFPRLRRPHWKPNLGRDLPVVEVALGALMVTVEMAWRRVGA